MGVEEQVSRRRTAKNKVTSSENVKHKRARASLLLTQLATRLLDNRLSVMPPSHTLAATDHIHNVNGIDSTRYEAGRTSRALVPCAFLRVLSDDSYSTGAPKIFRVPSSRVFSAFLEHLQVRGRRKRFAT